MMQSSNRRPNRVTKSTAPRRPNNRRLDDEQLAAQLIDHGTITDEHYQAAAAVASAVGVTVPQHHGGGHDQDHDTLMVDSSFKDTQDGPEDVDTDNNNNSGHGPNVGSMDGMPMAPMHAHHPDHGQSLDGLTDPEMLQGNGSLDYAAATAAAVASLHSPPPPEGSTMPAPQPLVAATDFQPNPPPPPPPPQHQQQPLQTVQAPPQPAPSHRMQHIQSASSPSQQKPTEQMAQESGYEDFKVDSAFAKRLARDPGQRIAEQRRPGQELNLVRRSNVEALLAQIAGTEAASPCAHCRKGQGPWTACVVYSGQMMGSCANCWFNASGARCSFHEKSQPVQAPTNPYAVTVALPGPAGANNDQLGASSGNMASTSQAQLQAAALWNASGALFSHDAGVKGTVQNALMQVRQATSYQRALIEVEVAAKQLALKIVQAEELASALGEVDGEMDGGELDDGNDHDHEHEHDPEHQNHQYHSPPGDDGQEGVS